MFVYSEKVLVERIASSQAPPVFGPTAGPMGEPQMTNFSLRCLQGQMEKEQLGFDRPNNSIWRYIPYTIPRKVIYRLVPCSMALRVHRRGSANHEF